MSTKIPSARNLENLHCTLHQVVLLAYRTYRIERTDTVLAIYVGLEILQQHEPEQITVLSVYELNKEILDE